MAFVQPSSCECCKSELQLFWVPPTQTAIESTQWLDVGFYHGLPCRVKNMARGTQ